eukprot:CAMPEP_0184648310 /NCGR_PEP_ID=MMETSP0308-20130426/5399_1 /TAXON_ID=38269 /ORGANISM="Gloeochaete witrockiana, Strain SAG 46.84" /LENGTH=526 /DNA_ID=CAMNT_0027080033 /DNA_START=115 /DNA_END=1695 /DNA_ORIENTATION=-
MESSLLHVASFEEFEKLWEEVRERVDVDYKMLCNYHPFSKETYGETQAWVFDKMMNDGDFPISSSDSFLDLGCGFGNICFQIAATVGCKCYGMEVRKEVWDLGERINTEFKRLCEERHIAAGDVTLMHVDGSDRSVTYEGYTRVFCNNIAFPENVQRAVLLNFDATLRHNAKVLTFRDFDTKFDPRKTRMRDSPLHLFQYPWHKFKTGPGAVSWTDADITGFVYTVQRNTDFRPPPSPPPAISETLCVWPPLTSNALEFCLPAPSPSDSSSLPPVNGRKPAASRRKRRRHGLHNSDDGTSSSDGSIFDSLELVEQEELVITAKVFSGKKTSNRSRREKQHTTPESTSTSANAKKGRSKVSKRPKSKASSMTKANPPALEEDSLLCIRQSSLADSPLKEDSLLCSDQSSLTHPPLKEDSLLCHGPSSLAHPPLKEDSMRCIEESSLIEEARHPSPSQLSDVSSSPPNTESTSVPSLVDAVSPVSSSLSLHQYKSPMSRQLLSATFDLTNPLLSADIKEDAYIGCFGM